MDKGMVFHVVGARPCFAQQGFFLYRITFPLEQDTEQAELLRGRRDNLHSAG
nr:hypothetical protein [Terriglobus albidus]